jgi:hypothetical protein
MVRPAIRKGWGFTGKLAMSPSPSQVETSRSMWGFGGFLELGKMNLVVMMDLKRNRENPISL